MQLKNDGAPIDWVALPPVVARAQGIGLARKAPHPYAGMLFVDFLLSDGQSILAQRDFFPTNTKVKPMPAGLDPQFLEPAKLLDEGDRLQKLYQSIVGNQPR